MICRRCVVRRSFLRTEVTQEAGVDISIVSGWLPIVVVLVAVVVAVASVVGRDFSPRRLVLVALVTGAAAALVALGLRLSGSHFPASTVWWSAAALALLAYAVWDWGSVRRGLAVTGVVLLAAVALGSFNAAYGTYPTLERLDHLNAVHHVTASGLSAIARQAEAARTVPGEGAVVEEHIPPTVSHFEAEDAYIYVPPAWFRSPRPSLPTLMLLPGEPGDSSDWTAEGDADSTADAYAAQHGGRAPIIVMPDPNGRKTVDSECVNSQFGNAETYLTVDVPAYVRSRFGAANGPHSMAVAGLSAGGTCATMLALRHPDQFDTFASFSGFSEPTYKDDGVAESIRILFDGSKEAFDAHDPMALVRTNRYPGLAGWFEVGDQDVVPREQEAQLATAARAAGIETCIKVLPGGHDYGVWRQAFTDALPWLAWRLGLTAVEPQVAATCTPGKS
jgi:S-formylglutathione hydrolase FrmB